MIDYKRIPANTIETLAAWITDARPVGSFCEAVIRNNLREAVSRADPHNRQALPEIVTWMCNYAPLGSWGSAEVLETWPAFLKGDEPYRRHPNFEAHLREIREFARRVNSQK